MHQLKGVPGKRRLFLIAPEAEAIAAPKKAWSKLTCIAGGAIAIAMALGFAHLLTSGPTPSPDPEKTVSKATADHVGYGFRTSFGTFNVDNQTEDLEYRVRRMIVQPVWSSSDDPEFRALRQLQADSSATQFDLKLGPDLQFHPHRFHGDQPRPAGAEDLRFSLRRFFDQLKVRATIDITAPDAVRIKTEKPYPLMGGILADASFPQGLSVAHRLDQPRGHQRHPSASSGRSGLRPRAATRRKDASREHSG